MTGGTEMGGMSGQKPCVRLSVRAVVETTLHERDLSPAAGAARRMREGALAHRARQSGEGTRDTQYRAEVALAAVYEGERLTLRVSGRADGISMRTDGMPVIEEIKLGAPDAPLVPAHQAQARMYGHMLCCAEGYACAALRVLYVDAQGAPLRAYEEELPAQALREAFDALCAPACAWEAEKLARRQRRDASLGSLPFPYPAYRAGQHRFAQNVFVAIRERRRLFAQAPTGIGKTMAALYPALVALGQGYAARAVFLTARVTGREAAISAMRTLGAAGARTMTVEIAAKDKVCPQETRDCRPEVCPCADGFYDRLPAALDEALHAQDGLFDRARIEALAGKHALCPFELSLELSQLADVIVGDTNYVYDPFVALNVLLQAPGGACLLVDEAHQLGGRVRDAYSGGVSADELCRLRREAGQAHGRKSALYRALTRAIRALSAVSEEEAFDSGRLDAPPEALCEAVDAVMDSAGEQLALGGSACAADAFRMAAAFSLAAGRFDARYAALTGGGKKHASLLLQCLDASQEVLAASKRARGTVYFSATLAPFDAARRTLGSEEGDACLLLPSPFDPARLHVRIAPIDIRYAAREATAAQVAGEIASLLRGGEGNALVFFPSYAYMERISELVLGEEGLTQIRFAREKRGLREEEKRAMLEAFSEDGERCALFAVLGGAFSEGIDLPGRRLQNVVVVSTGMPQPDAQVRAMQAYYDAQGGNGFDMAMTLPGMVRVIQAAGRLIRTPEDEGELLLIDQRFRSAKVRGLLRGTLIGDALGIE